MVNHVNIGPHYKVLHLAVISDHSIASDVFLQCTWMGHWGNKHTHINTSIIITSNSTHNQLDFLQLPRSRDHSGYGISQWKEALNSNASSHWLCPSPEWSLIRVNQQSGLNSLSPGVMWIWIWIRSFQMCCSNYFHEHFQCYWLQINGVGPNLWWVNIGSGDGLVPSDTEPLTEQMLTKIYVATGTTLTS